MRKSIFLLVTLIVFVGLCTGCTEKKTNASGTDKERKVFTSSVRENVDRAWNENVARYVTEDGWVYTFSYMYWEDNEDDSLIPYTFSACNLRYRYNDGYQETTYVCDDPSKPTEILPANMQNLGSAAFPEYKEDMELVAEILGYNKTPNVTKEELLALNPDDYKFNTLDKDLFFSLMCEALNGEAHAEGNYGLQNNIIECEQEFEDDYKFQVGYASAMGVVDIIYIDVLYKTGDRYNDYVQLYDLVKDGKANEKQLEAYELIENIEKGIISNNDFLYECEANCNKIIGGIDFYRLYKLLNDISAY